VVKHLSKRLDSRRETRGRSLLGGGAGLRRSILGPYNGGSILGGGGARGGEEHPGSI